MVIGQGRIGCRTEVLIELKWSISATKLIGCSIAIVVSMAV